MRLGPNLLHAVDHKKGEHNINPMSPGFTPVDIPVGKSGEWSVARYTLNAGDVGLYNLRLIRDGMIRRVVPPGTYTKLTDGRDVVMTDTPAESHEHRLALKLATGSVLINGLGLGFYLKAVLAKPGVTKVTVIEKSEDVIKLVDSSYSDPRLTIICADALTWKPPKGERYDFVWHDIWATICDDNKAQMTQLRHKYARRTKAQACWSAEYLD